MLRLLTFGGLRLVPEDQAAPPRVRPLRLALLAVLATAGDRGMSRERLIGLFWPDSDDRHGHHSLRQALYALRRELGCEAVRQTPAALSLDLAVLRSDVGDFHAAILAGDRARAAEVGWEPFLGGFDLPRAPEFERWLEEERARFTAAATAALLSLATEASEANEYDAAAEWWRQLVAREPVSGRFALGYLKALAARGDRGEALAFARRHEAVVRRELEVDPDPNIRRLEAELRALSAPAPHASYPRRESAAGASPREEPSQVSRAGSAAPPAPARGRRRATVGTGGVVVLVLVALTAVARHREWFLARHAQPILAVGLLNEDGLADTLRSGGVLTDMMATSLARVDGLSVLANTRLLELMGLGQEGSAAGYADAARRAGATELLEGRVTAAATPGLALELRRVDLRTGVVRRVYRVAAWNWFALVDSVTQLMAREFERTAPRESIATATTHSPIAYRLYEEGLRAYYRSELTGAYRLMLAALEEDSTFAMAAYYASILAPSGGELLPDGSHASTARRRALRLAARVPDRERLTITTELLARDLDPRSLAVAETLAARYPDDPRALASLATARATAGEWRRAAAALEHAITLDSAAEPGTARVCRLCDDFLQLANVYFWWDSLPAAERAAYRFIAVRPASQQPYLVLATVASRTGQVAVARASLLRLTTLGPASLDPIATLRFDLALELYGDVAQQARALLLSPREEDFTNGRWHYLIALRNQGRLREASDFFRTGELEGRTLPAGYGARDDIIEAVLALEQGDARLAADLYGRRRHIDASAWAPGLRARHMAWSATLEGMARAAAGDIPAVRRLADTVELWGRGTAYGRDRKGHHYLRGLVLAAEGRQREAVREYRAAIHSTTLGFTRVNYELGRSLLQLGRTDEAIAILQPALRGEIDASNLYVTRTELHELLAQSFDRAGQRDSAAVHYRAVVKSWERADPQFQSRRERAIRRLAGP